MTIEGKYFRKGVLIGSVVGLFIGALGAFYTAKYMYSPVRITSTQLKVPQMNYLKLEQGKGNEIYFTEQAQRFYTPLDKKKDSKLISLLENTDANSELNEELDEEINLNPSEEDIKALNEFIDSSKN